MYAYILTQLLAVSITPAEAGLPDGNTSISSFIIKIISIALTVVGLTSVVAVIIGGLQMVASAGDPARYKTGRQTVTYAVAGVIIAIISGAVVSFISQRIG